MFYELQRFGLRFVESPRHADILLVTGPLTRNLRSALEQAWDATPEPKWVIAVGDCAVDGGVFKGSYAVLGGTGKYSGATGTVGLAGDAIRTPTTRGCQARSTRAAVSWKRVSGPTGIMSAALPATCAS